MGTHRAAIALFILCLIAVCTTAHGQQSALGANVAKYVTATMDGTYDWYERGFNPDAPNTGLPPAGITTATTGSTGTQGPSGTFLLQPYTGNNVLLLNSGNTTGTLTLTTPTEANALWITSATGIGPAHLNTVTHFSDGTPDFTQNFFTLPDWFSATPNVFEAAGRVQIYPTDIDDEQAAAGTFQAGGYGFPTIAVTTIVFPNPALHPISSIDLSWVPSATSPYYTSNTAIFGVSLSTNGAAGPFNAVQLTPTSFDQDVVVESTLPSSGPLPEPGGLLGCGLLAMLLSRHRKRGIAEHVARSHAAERLESRLVLSQLIAVTNLTDDPSATGTLRSAIESAQNGDTVAFASFIALSQGPHVITLNSPIEVTTSFTLQGLGAGIISVSGNEAGRVFLIDNNAAPTFSGISITQGNDTVDQYGGAVYINAGASLTLSGVTVSNNQGSDWGGGIANFGTLNVTNCSFANNSSLNGGAIANFGVLNVSLSNFSGNSSDDGGAIGGRGVSPIPVVTIDRTTFQDNTTFHGSGQGGAGIGGQGTLLLTNSSFFGNISFDGAAGVDFSGNVTVDSCVFSSNGGNFGAISVGGNATISRSTMDGNGGPPGRGSAAAVENYGTLNLVACIVSNNSSNGINNTGTLNLINSTVAQNSTTQTGGGVMNSGVLTSRNSTIALNYAVQGGGGIATTTAGVTLYNSIVAGNTSTIAFDNALAPNDISGTVTGSFNLIGTGGSGGLVNSVNYNMVGVADAGLAPLNNYGGPTETMALLPGSLAFNAGSVLLAVDQNGQPLPTDQRGSPRVVSSSVDVGAYEASGPPGTLSNLAAVPGTDQISLTWKSNGSNGPFAVYRGTSPGGEGAQPIASLSTNSFVDGNTIDGVTYYYRVAPADAFGPGNFSNEVSATAIPMSPLVSFDGTGGLALQHDPDLVHIDWSFGGNTGQFLATDPNPITVIGNSGLTEIGLNDTRGTPIPKVLHLQGDFEFRNSSFNGYYLFDGNTIDIGSGTVYFDYGGTVGDPDAALLSYLYRGYDNGAWDGVPSSGSAAIVSSAVAAGSPGEYSIGYADSADGTVAGQPANTVEIRFTVSGDANLDGVVDLKDAAILQANWNATGAPAWDQGNFNYDNAVDLNDALLMTRNWNATVPGVAVPESSASASADPGAAALSGAIPPTTNSPSVTSSAESPASDGSATKVNLSGTTSSTPPAVQSSPKISPPAPTPATEPSASAVPIAPPASTATATGGAHAVPTVLAVRSIGSPLISSPPAASSSPKTTTATTPPVRAASIGVKTAAQTNAAASVAASLSASAVDLSSSPHERKGKTRKRLSG